ncbi:Abi family protein, partial [Ellagibacter isourolithinifaciens]|uniref:Abi family protein n=1 Tax=Ellagibacter isourolithinifaciens TaxID=2137581 RepID=UPI003A9415F0
MDKPFKTIEEQVELLEARGVATDDGTPEVLLREGYYSVVNGYKAPFIDKEKSESAKDDRYLPGTSFADIYALFMFDRELRMLFNMSRTLSRGNEGPSQENLSRLGPFYHHPMISSDRLCHQTDARIRS